MADDSNFVPLQFSELPESDMLERARGFYQQLQKRRTTRHFSKRSVNKELIELAVRSAGTAPSGAHLQPWTFVVISNSELKQKIRTAAEDEEKRFYDERIPEAWQEVLTPLGTDHVKEHITDAPWIVILFRHSQRQRKDGTMSPTYYSQESCGIAAGMFIAAIHDMGLACLTHTPSPMGFLAEILERPEHESAMLLMPIGYPSDGATVPDLERKDISEILIFKE